MQADAEMETESVKNHQEYLKEPDAVHNLSLADVIEVWRDAMDARDGIKTQEKKLNALMEQCRFKVTEELDARGEDIARVPDVATCSLQTKIWPKVVDQERAKEALMELGFDDCFREQVVARRLNEVVKQLVKEGRESELQDAVEITVAQQAGIKRLKTKASQAA